VKESPQSVSRIGRYTGELSPAYVSSGLPKLLEDVPSLLKSDSAVVLSDGRNRNVKVTVADQNTTLELVVKRFARQNLLKDMLAAKRGSKAHRTWQAARFLQQHGIGTPAPVAYLERWNGSKLEESFYISEYCDGIISFKDELIRLFKEEPECACFMSLMNTVADAVSTMHLAGFQHNDLGNQNIFVERSGPGQYHNVRFLDLNRAEIKPELSTRRRARDISRIYLPSDLLRVFKDMYCRGAPPRSFEELENFYRKRYAIHSVTRKYRHPFREKALREAKKDKKTSDYPSEKDMWIWDERSSQAISILQKKDRRRYHSGRGQLKMFGDTVRSVLPVRVEYRNLMQSCYENAVDLKNRAGISLNLRGNSAKQEIELLKELGDCVPVMTRFYCHENKDVWKKQTDVIRSLAKDGHEVSIALVQDRRAVTDEGRWKQFAGWVLDSVGGVVKSVEIGHAINRVKWGVWDMKDYRRLIGDVADLPSRYPDVEFTGPAVIDFEYPFLISALKNLPAGMRFDSMSHHLYVDRRGAPENEQAGFSALEKFALARAIGKISGKCSDKLVISEVNWPIRGTGVYSPVNSPYETGGPRKGDPSVSEDEYADYMIRYLLIALCSGMVDKVYWWRLAARGFGLIDDTDDTNWRKRPAYHAFAYFISILNKASFTKKISLPDNDSGGVHMFMFNHPHKGNVYVGYSSAGYKMVSPPFKYRKVTDALGNEVPGEPNTPVMLGARPVYLE